MKKTYFKLITLLAILTMLVLFYTSAVTQVKYFQKNQTVESPVATDSFDIGTLTADDPWIEMEKIATAGVSKNEQLDFTGTMSLIDDNGDKEKILEVYPFKYSIYKDNYYYKLASMEWVNKKKFSLAIDHESKKIGYAAIQGSAQKPFFDL